MGGAITPYRLDRLIALRWFDSDHALLVDTVVTKVTPDLHSILFHSVRVNLAIWLRRQMPGGRVSQEMQL